MIYEKYRDPLTGKIPGLYAIFKEISDRVDDAKNVLSNLELAMTSLEDRILVIEKSLNIS